MPFSDQQFDVVISRYSAHHWQHVPTAMKEVNRVLKPDGIVIFVDIISSSSPILDTFYRPSKRFETQVMYETIV